MRTGMMIQILAKLPAHRAGASRRGSFIHIVPLHPAYNAGLAGHVPAKKIRVLTG